MSRFDGQPILISGAGRALACEAPGDPLAEAAPGARDQDRLAVEAAHHSIPNSLAV